LPTCSAPGASSILVLADEDQHGSDEHQGKHDDPDGGDELLQAHRRLRKQLARDRIDGTQSPTKMPYSLLTKNHRTTENIKEMNAATSQRIIDKSNLGTSILLR
jgi:hypothetical protein